MTLLLAVLLAAAPAGGDAVARVDGVAVTRDDVAERLRVLGARGQKIAPAQALGSLVDEAVLAAEARRQGLDRDPTVTEAIASERRQLLTKALEEELQSKLTPNDETLRKMYHSTGDAVRAAVIKVVSREQAEDGLKRLRAGGDLAAEAGKSIDPRLARGDVTVSRGELEAALADAAFAAPVGGVFGPVELKLGWAYGKVLERTVADEAGFPARRPALEAFVRKQLSAEALAHLTQKSKAKASVKIDEAFLKGLGNRVDATPKELEHVIATVNGIPLRYAAIHRSVAYIASAGKHAAGPTTKISLAEKAADELVLESVALERGLARSPVVASVLPGIERYVLANALATRIAGSAGAGLADPKVRSKVSELRGRARIELDESRLAGLPAR